MILVRAYKKNEEMGAVVTWPGQFFSQQHARAKTYEDNEADSRRPVDWAFSFVRRQEAVKGLFAGRAVKHAGACRGAHLAALGHGPEDGAVAEGNP